MKAYDDLIKKTFQTQFFGMILTKIHVFFFFKNNHFFQNIMCIFIKKEKKKGYFSTKNMS